MPFASSSSLCVLNSPTECRAEAPCVSLALRALPNPSSSTTAATLPLPFLLPFSPARGLPPPLPFSLALEAAASSFSLEAAFALSMAFADSKRSRITATDRSSLDSTSAASAASSSAPHTAQSLTKAAAVATIKCAVGSTLLFSSSPPPYALIKLSAESTSRLRHSKPHMAVTADSSGSKSTPHRSRDAKVSVAVSTHPMRTHPRSKVLTVRWLGTKVSSRLVSASSKALAPRTSPASQ
mmetsp:Transcript_55929/g.112091  ORF Transcript_55929/g.112091 Transcript_55929/m.112091 type:complete len:239 (+) Transcript_55929:181-897(+)